MQLVISNPPKSRRAGKPVRSKPAAQRSKSATMAKKKSSSTRRANRARGGFVSGALLKTAALTAAGLIATEVIVPRITAALAKDKPDSFFAKPTGQAAIKLGLAAATAYFGRKLGPNLATPLAVGMGASAAVDLYRQFGGMKGLAGNIIDDNLAGLAGNIIDDASSQLVYTDAA
jgi:hypothetical protein